MTESVVSLRNVVKQYVRGKQGIEVLQGLTLDIPKGEFVALMGPSGSGKTTLLNLIGGLDKPTSGEITVAGQRLDQLGERRPVALARAPHRIRVPVLQSDADAERPAQRGAAPAAHQPVGRAAQGQRPRRADSGRPRRSRQAQAERAVRRPGATRRHCPRARRRSDPAALRRADRRPRPQVRR